MKKVVMKVEACQGYKEFELTRLEIARRCYNIHAEDWEINKSFPFTLVVHIRVPDHETSRANIWKLWRAL